MTITRARAVRFGVMCAAATAVACNSQCGGPVVSTPTPTGTSEVVVTFSTVGAADRPLLLYSGKRDGACRAFEPHVGTASSTITLTAVSYDAACPTEFAAFAPGFGAYGRVVLVGASADLSWLQGVITSGTVDIPLGALTPVPLTVWIVADNAADRTSAGAKFADHLAELPHVHDQRGAGFAVTYVLRDIAPSALTASCTAAGTISSTSAIYDPATINVYYVKSPAMYGKTCWKENHSEIEFISWGNEDAPPEVLAHELGHSLGLFHPKGPTNNVGGHTDFAPAGSFDDNNLMWSAAHPVTNASVGQLYAMNFSGDSWLNRSGSTTPRPVMRVCQDAWGAGACPALTLFVAGWPVP